jgi:hypothetical protein
VANYFDEGAKEAGIIQEDGTINAWPKNVTLTPGTGSASLQADASSTSSSSATMTEQPEETSTAFVPGYTVRITGPGMDTKIAIKDEDDVEIVEIMLKKVRKLLKNMDLV